MTEGKLHRFRAHMTHPRHRRLRPRLFLLHLGALLHRRWQCHGAARRAAAAGHGVRAVPSDRHLRRGLPDHRRRARRGRLPHQFRGRALHGALRAERQGPGLARCGQPRDDDRDPRGPRRRREHDHIHLHLEHLGAGGDPRAPARHRRDRAHLRRRGCDQGADPGAADGALQHGRHSLQLSRRGGAPDRPAIPTRWCPGLMAVGEAACVSVHGANRLGSQLAAGPGGLRPRGGTALRGAHQARRAAHQRAAADAGDAGGRAPGPPAPRQRLARRRPPSASRCRRPCRPMRRCSAPGSPWHEGIAAHRRPPSPPSRTCASRTAR